MSSRIRGKVTQELMQKELVATEEKTQCLATAIYQSIKSHPFLGSVLQCLNISYSHVIETAGIMFNTDAKRWDMIINPYFFAKKLKEENRKAILLHELSHITHKHPLRVPFLKISEHKRMLMNIAADMAINQFIDNIPKGCQSCPKTWDEGPCTNEMCPGKGIDVADFFDIDAKGNKKTWDKNQPMEYYYEKLLTKFSDSENKKDGSQSGNAGGGAESPNLPQTIDEHMWGDGAEECDMLEATEDLVKRAMIKCRWSYDELPGHIKELLEDIKARKAELNYKALIMSALKKHASGHNRKHTWTRKSKRFGCKAPGTKVGDLPKLDNKIDTSGSISIEEANEFLDIIDQFLRVGSRKCRLSLFHTEQYYSEEYKLGNRLTREVFQSGGTDLTPSLKDIWKRKPDLAVFLTDGYYSDVNVEEWMKPGDKFPQCVFIISREGQENHPLVRLGQTIKIPAGARKK